MFNARGLVHHVWPYSSATNSVEYPPLTGVVMWATAIATPHGYDSDKIYFLINILLIAALFVGTTLLVARINPSKWYLLPVMPAVVASLYINWDMWAVFGAIAAIYWFDKKKYALSSIALAISIATKFFPVVLFIPIVVIFLKQREYRIGARYLLQTGVLWVVINAPFALTTPTGWWRFFKLNGSRPADLGSLWQAMNIFNIYPPHINIYWIVIFGASSLVVVGRLLRNAKPPTLAQIAFVFVALFTAFNKVYSPQYVLWLAPLGVIALQNKSNRPAFWVWQGSEALYHFAIWEYLGGYAGAKFALPPKWYAAIILIRISSTLIFALRILLSTREELPPGRGISPIGDSELGLPFLHVQDTGPFQRRSSNPPAVEIPRPL